ncbi:hypothetical protein [Streptomyces sp. NPDC002746]
MTNWKKTGTAAAVTAVTCGALLAGAPAGAQVPTLAAKAPVAIVIFKSQSTHKVLNGSDGAAGVGSFDDWALQVPSGAPQGVYQVQRSGTLDCLEAGPQGDVLVLRCETNPGKNQRWALDRTPGEKTTIESRLFPGKVLTNMAKTPIVELEDRKPEEELDPFFPDQLWEVISE